MPARKISSMELRHGIGDILNRVCYADERFIVERKGRPVAAIISVDMLERLERMEAECETELLCRAKPVASESGASSLRDLAEQDQGLRIARQDQPTEA